jgi:glycosyltransferase involved in cell wall biosynthesis
VRVTLVGGSVNPAVAALASDPDVTVVFDAPSVTPWYQSTTVAVAPLRAGGGTRLKILEAFAHGTPVVSTSRGAEGLPVTDGVDLLIADDTVEFARSCGRLLEDEGLRAALADTAADVAAQHARPRIVQLANSLLRHGAQP